MQATIGLPCRRHCWALGDPTAHRVATHRVGVVDYAHRVVNTAGLLAQYCDFSVQILAVRLDNPQGYKAQN